MTFSIVGWDIETGMTGTAASTANLAIGAVGYNIKANVGAVATQADPHPILGNKLLRLLEEGVSATDALEVLLKNDKEKHRRQIHLVDCAGQTAAWTGDCCVEWAGHIIHPGFSVAGNMLVSAKPIQAMAEAYIASQDFPFPERLLQALEAGQAAGGDKRGRQSAVLFVVNTESYGLTDLRVDDHRDPVAELRRIFEESKKPYYVAFRKTMPTNVNPDGLYDS
jgi:uncharacterized Ntn-hydrolase superfamily protein